jgi:hypothetical protein
VGRQVRDFRDTSEAFGFNVPILVDAELKVIAGRGRLLGEQLRELSELNLDFRLEATVSRFRHGRDRSLIEGASAPTEPDPDDLPPSVSSVAPVTRPGDIWLLGPTGSIAAARSTMPPIAS